MATIILPGQINRARVGALKDDILRLGARPDGTPDEAVLVPALADALAAVAARLDHQGGGRDNVESRLTAFATYVIRSYRRERDRLETGAMGGKIPRPQGETLS